MPQSLSRPFQRALVKLYQVHIIWHLDWCNFCLKKFEKNCEVILARSLTQVSENTPKIISIGPRITEKLPFKKLKILSFLAPFISKIKTADIFNFLSVKYFSVSENLTYKSQLLLKLRAVELAISFLSLSLRSS